MQWEYVGQLAEEYAELQEEAIELTKCLGDLVCD